MLNSFLRLLGFRASASTQTSDVQAPQTDEGNANTSGASTEASSIQPRVVSEQSAAETTSDRDLNLQAQAECREGDVGDGCQAEIPGTSASSENPPPREQDNTRTGTFHASVPETPSQQKQEEQQQKQVQQQQKQVQQRQHNPEKRASPASGPDVLSKQQGENSQGKMTSPSLKEKENPRTEGFQASVIKTASQQQQQKTKKQTSPVSDSEIRPKQQEHSKMEITETSQTEYRSQGQQQIPVSDSIHVSEKDQKRETTKVESPRASGPKKFSEQQHENKKMDYSLESGTENSEQRKRKLAGPDSSKAPDSEVQGQQKRKKF